MVTVRALIYEQEADPQSPWQTCNFLCEKNTNLIHTAKKAMDRNYLFMNNSENHEQRTPGGTVPLSLLESFNSHFPLKTFDYLLLRCFLWKSINTDSTIGLQSLLTSCNSTNLEAHIINILHTHQTSQKFHPRTDIVINLPVIIWKYSEVLSSVVKKNHASLDH